MYRAFHSLQGLASFEAVRAKALVSQTKQNEVSFV